MRIVILSDIHDNVWKLAAALESIEEADVMICCGDLCSPFIVDQLAQGFAGPIHIVFGNNDGDPYRCTMIANRYAHVHIHGELFQTELDGRRMVVQHFNNIALKMAGSGEFDVVCYGHNHVYKVERVGETLTINPGAIMGYSPSAQQDIPSTFVVYDTQTDGVITFEV
jgi:hypothetical protein